MSRNFKRTPLKIISKLWNEFLVQQDMTAINNALNRDKYWERQKILGRQMRILHSTILLLNGSKKLKGMILLHKLKHLKKRKWKQNTTTILLLNRCFTNKIAKHPKRILFYHLVKFNNLNQYFNHPLKLWNPMRHSSLIKIKLILP